MRSFLFVPGDNEHMFKKACQSEADALILDLEDSVALSAKEKARQVVQQSLQNKRTDQKWFVRVNDLDTGLTLDDLTAVMPYYPDGIVLPKVTGQKDIQQLDYYLQTYESVHQRAKNSTLVIGIATENARAVLSLPSFDKYEPNLLYGLKWGGEDLAGSLGALRNKEKGSYTSPFVLARDLCLMAAAADGVVAIDSICADIRNLPMVEQEASQAKRDGFSAKAVIHPSHLQVVNQVFTPTSNEVSWAQKVIDAFTQNPDLGVVNIDGQMIDKPHERIAKNIISRAQNSS